MSGALKKIKKQLEGGKLTELMKKMDDIREGQERTNDLLEKILKEMREHAD